VGNYYYIAYSDSDLDANDCDNNKVAVTILLVRMFYLVAKGCLQKCSF